MRAGTLDRVIEIQERFTGLDLYGTPVDVWTTSATVRAQVLQYDTTNREGVRTTTDTTITFRIYWLNGLSLEHRISYDGKQYTIRQIKELGRRVGSALVCESAGP